MKIKPDFVLREVAGTWAVLPLNKDVLSFDGMLSLNESGALLWKILASGANREELADYLTNEYDVSRIQALVDVDEFVAKLRNAGCLLE